MAPEIALRKPYGEKVDVFSYSMLLREIVSLEFLYPEYTTIKDYFIRVCKCNGRPSFLESRWSSDDQVVPGAVVLKTIITEGWDPTPQQRPTMKRIGSVLRGLLNDMVEEELLHADDHFNLTLDENENDGAIRNRTNHMMNRSNNSKQFDISFGPARKIGGRQQSSTTTSIQCKIVQRRSSDEAAA